MMLACCMPVILALSALPFQKKPESNLEPRHLGLMFHTVTELALDPSGQTLYAASEHGQLAAWDVKREIFRWEFTPDGAFSPVIGLRAGPELLTYITEGGTAVGVVIAATGKNDRIQILGKATGSTTALAHDPTGKWTWAGMRDGTLYRLKSDADNAPNGVKLENDGATVMALDSDAQQLAIGGADGTIRFVNARTGSVDKDRVIKAHDGPITALAWTRGDAAIVSGSQDRSLRAWRPSTRAQAFALDSLPGAVTCVAVDPTGKLLAWGDDQGAVHLWDLSTHKTLVDLTDESTGKVNAAVFLDKGKSLAAAMGHKHISFWDVSGFLK